MSEDQERRAADLLRELRTATPPARADLAERVAHRARWQRQLRHVLVSIGSAAGGAGHGLVFMLRRR
jgi:hypothetical protein